MLNFDHNPGKFLTIHLHCAGVRATLLSAGIFPSFNKPIVFTIVDTKMLF